MTARFPKIPDELLQKLDIAAPRYTSYPTAPCWGPQVGPAQYASALARRKGKSEPLSLYVHIPFCRERCSFCGCNVIITRAQEAGDRYLDTLEKEFDLVVGQLGRGQSLMQIHLGGGTPTFLDEKQLSRLWTMIESRFSLASGAEVAIEIDPMETSAGQLRLLRKLGFNRLSLGVQDLDPNVQAAICRTQGLEPTRDALELARELGFRGINVDLIYGLPRQTPDSWAQTLEKIMSLRPDRAAVYSFAYIPDVRPNQRRLPSADLPGPQLKLKLFGMAWDAFRGNGYYSIGMDHFALPDDELSRAQAAGTLSRNFQGYTIRPGSGVIAVGPSSISDLDGTYAQNAHQLAKWERSINGGQLATERGIELTDEDARRRVIIQNLLCNFTADLGTDGRVRYADELAKLEELATAGLLRIEGTRVDVLELGRIFVRSIASRFDTRSPVEQKFSRVV